MGVKRGMARPGKVTAAIVLQWIQSGATGLLGIGLLVFGGTFVERMVTGAVAFMAGGVAVIGFAVLVGIATAALAGGHEWARITALTLAGLAIVWSLVSLFITGGNFLVLAGIPFPAVIFWALSQDDARQWCVDRRYLREQDRRRAAKLAAKR